MTTHRSKLSLLAVFPLLALGMMGCAAKPPAVQASMQLAGTLTRRGGQIEAFWGVRAQDGKLWRLEAGNAQIESQMQQMLQQPVRVSGQMQQGEAANASPLPPVFKVLQIELLAH
jgi:hypothetical protein